MNRTVKLFAWALLPASLVTAGCEPPPRIVTYPQGCLKVHYEAATTYSTCLVASVAMAANYRLGERRFSEPGICADLTRMGLDQTSVADVKKYLQTKGLHLVTLVGELDGKPPAALRYWLESRGYPVICVINRNEKGAEAFNHAVVVIGISAKTAAQSADTIYYLDPGLAKQLGQSDASAFEALWARCGHAMMIVVVPAPPTHDRGPLPPESQPAQQSGQGD